MWSSVICHCMFVAVSRQDTTVSIGHDLLPVREIKAEVVLERSDLGSEAWFVSQDDYN